MKLLPGAGAATLRLLALPLAVILSSAPARAQGTATAFAQIPPAPTQRVTDLAGFLSPGAAAELDAQIRDFEARTGHQALVYIGKSTEPTTLEEFAVRAYEAWGVGKKGKDDGIVLFLMADDKKVRIEVGYGLEGEIPDARAGRIITEIIVPRLKAGQNDEAIRAGLGELLGSAEGKGSLPPPRGAVPQKSEGPGCLGWILIAIIAAIFLYILITNPALAIWLLVNALSGGRGGGGGGGGWSGGGGRSGGGGASGSW